MQRSLDFLAPVARKVFQALAHDLEMDTPFLPFETYRSPEDQEHDFRRGTSKAHAFESAHQFGLAVDFVPFINGNWTWTVPDDVWNALVGKAAAHGLLVPIAWDRGHVEHPCWKGVQRSIRTRS